MKKLLSCLFFGLSLTVLGGCASDPAPLEQMRLTEQAVQQARAVGADEQTAELVLAELKLAAARVAMNDEDFRQARLLSEQAELDARLAEARVLNAKSASQIAELNRGIERLRQQLGDLR
ncbi:putative lipoprotein [Stutzerimonas stutzeri TS44]|nr:putative lipoprotein [Stutzerimonas stutzeri TS44]